MKTFTSLSEYQKAYNLKEDDIFSIKFAQPGIAVVSRLGERTNDAYQGEIFEAPDTAPEIPENLIPTFDYTKGYEITADDNGNITTFAYNVDPETKDKKIVAGRAIEKVFFQYIGGLLNQAKKQDPTETVISEIPNKRD